MNPPPLRYKFMHYITTVDGYEAGSYWVDNHEWSTVPSTTLTLYINCSITIVVVNNGVCPTHLSSMLEVIEMVECPSCMSHMLRGD